MITYLVIHNGEVNKSYKCNTTHTSVPYIRVNEKNYLDLTTETTTGLQLKYKQKTGSSYSTYNTEVISTDEFKVTLTSGYTTEESTKYTSSEYTKISSSTNNYITTTQSKVTFKNRIYIPVQSQSTTVSTTRSSLYTNTTGYSGRSTYNTTTYTTTGYTGASWWSENHVSTTGYSHSSTSYRTTGSGYRSTTTQSSYKVYTKQEYSSGYKITYDYKYTRRYTWSHTVTSKWSFQNGGSNSSTSTHMNTEQSLYTVDTWSYTASTSSSQILSSSSSSTWTYSTFNTQSFTVGEGHNGDTAYPQQTGSYWRNYRCTESFTSRESRIGANTFRSNLNTYDYGTNSEYVAYPEYGLYYSTISSKWQTETATSRYATTDYSGWYPDFTATVTGLQRRTNYYTGTAYTANATELTQGYTTRFSSLASSSIPGQLSSTTALTSSGTRTSSSLKQSSKPGLLVSITELTITSTRTSLTNRTSSTDL